MKKNVALIFGGEGKERHISEASAENLVSIINTDLYDLMLVGITEEGEWYLYDGCSDKIKDSGWVRDKSRLKKTYPVKLGECSGFLCDGEIIPIHCAIPCLHGDFGEDGIIQGALSAAHINYIGQDTYASAFTSDKSYTKLAAEYLKIPTAKWLLLTSSNVCLARAQCEASLHYPLFLKPTRMGSSYGAHPVYSKEEFDAAYADAYAYCGKVLAEELIPVKYELECAFLETDGILLAPYGKITTDTGFYGYDEKYEGKETAKAEACKDGVDDRIKNLAIDYSNKLARFLGLRHLSRIDFFVTEDNRVYFNEINAFPGMTETSLYPTLTEMMGLQRGDFINLLVEGVCG